MSALVSSEGMQSVAPLSKVVKTSSTKMSNEQTECLYIATKFNDEARAKLVLRWQQLEQQQKMQMGVRHLLVSDEDVMQEDGSYRKK